ncbi:MAG: hypothetical protein K9H26_19205 [Prolixibacteraceae bacterium]|nr:hypothetical protein [Prolixibacteraceae bacterium]
MDTNRINNLHFTREINEFVVYKGALFISWDSAIRKIVSPLTIDSEEKFNMVLNSDFNQIVGNYMDFIPQTFQQYKELINSKLQIERRLRKNFALELGDLKVVLRHQLQPHEADVYYEASMTLVVNGNEIDRFIDGMDLCPELNFKVPGYISMGGWVDEIKDIAPVSDRIDFPLIQYEQALKSRTFIHKKHISKALLYKLYKDPATIGKPHSAKAYTGKVDIIELDMNNIDEQVLDVFIQHGVIRKQEPISDTEIAQMIAHAKSEAAKSVEAYSEWVKKYGKK